MEDGPDEEGNYYMRPGKTTDHIPSAFPNDEAAKAANLGMLPPDLTYFIETKENGRNYLFSFLTGWMDAPAGVTLTDLQHFNAYFPGGVVGMPQVSAETQPRGVHYIVYQVSEVCRGSHFFNLSFERERERELTRSTCNPASSTNARRID